VRSDLDAIKGFNWCEGSGVKWPISALLAHIDDYKPVLFIALAAAPFAAQAAARCRARSRHGGEVRALPPIASPGSLAFSRHAVDRRRTLAPRVIFVASPEVRLASVPPRRNR
jgi:hypothetical protein